jgi:hypothetical protein
MVILPRLHRVPVLGGAVSSRITDADRRSRVLIYEPRVSEESLICSKRGYVSPHVSQ